MRRFTTIRTIRGSISSSGILICMEQYVSAKALIHDFKKIFSFMMHEEVMIPTVDKVVARQYLRVAGKSESKFQLV